MEIIFLLIILFALGITNFVAFKVSRRNRKRRIWSGIIVLLITPIIFFISAVSISPFDPNGFGTGIISGLYAFSFLLNGIIILIIGLFTKPNLKN
jgi:protein-S-isoprenylcysteine O-methyltransferase Ste14